MKGKKLTSLLSLALAACLAFSVTGCNGRDDSDGANEKPRNPIAESIDRLYAGGLHKVNVTKTDNVLISEDGSTDYKIVYPKEAHEYELAAARYIAQQMIYAVDADIEVMEEDENLAYSANDKYIAVGSCKLFEKAGLTVPHVYEKNEKQGFLLLKDLGRQTYLDVLNEDNARELMSEAIEALVKWQSISEPGVLPEYDRALLTRELSLFPEWYIGRHRAKTLDERQSALLKVCFERILQNNLAQAKVFVHRDYMPRNLMVRDSDGPGILDYQDAVYGPVSYDIASLLRDAFISWGETFVIDMTIRYWEKARQAGIPVPSDFGVFWKDVEWMGLQRHLKVAGIFARLQYRDGKSKYLADTPRFINYIRHSTVFSKTI